MMLARLDPPLVPIPLLIADARLHDSATEPLNATMALAARPAGGPFGLDDDRPPRHHQ